MEENTIKPDNHSILLLLTQDLESPSGLGRYFPIAKYLVRAGYSVNIAALHSNFASLDRKSFVQNGVKVDYVSQMHVLKKGNQTQYFRTWKLITLTIKATWKLFKAATSKHYSIILIGKPHPMNGIAGILAGWIKRSKIIVDCDDYEAASNHYSSEWQRKVIQFFENLIPKFSNIVTTNTHFFEQRLISLGIRPEKIQYIPNGIDPDRFAEPDSREVEQLAKKLDLQDQKIVAYIGSLNLSNHSVDLLLKAFAILTSEYKAAHLLIVGGGSDRIKLEELSSELDIAKKTHFVGKVSSDLIPLYYRLADVTVDPVIDSDATRGRCPLKMFESWVMGVPFITADVGDRKQLAENSNITLITKPGDAIDLAKNLCSILSKESNILLKTTSEKETKSIETYYWENIINNHLKFY